MRVALAIFAITLTVIAETRSPEVLWQATIYHYSSGDAWTIIAGEFPRRPYYNPIAPPATFQSTLDAIFAADSNACINSVVIRNVSDIEGLREQIIAYLTHSGALKPYTATEPRRWGAKDVEKRGPELLRQAILKSDFVASLDDTLKKRGKGIRDVSVNNVAFLLNEDPANWLAMVNIYVDE